MSTETSAPPVSAPGPRFTPARLAELLGLPPPTAEQSAVIAAPLSPLLVVAGAGSGKTETMAARVVYLVANGMVRADAVLGLTFTRRAAGELGHRLRHRLSQLVRALPPGDEHWRGMMSGEPTVATYHSYAARVVAEHGLRAGHEPTTRLLSEAACWQLADAVVRGYDGDMSDVDLAPSTVTEAVLGLSADLAEHLCGTADLVRGTERLVDAMRALPGSMTAELTRVLGRQRARLQILPLVAGYAKAKRAAEAMDYGDQLARAARLAAGHPIVGSGERDRYRVVLLDEYQDTSHAQVVLLRALFGGGHPVTAVGDPCQSIYGWRGASAGTLNRFPADFPPGDDASAWGRAHLRRLSISWRNAEPILRVANAISAPVRAGDDAAVVLSAAPGRSGRGAGAAVRCALLDTAADEAAWLADRIAAIWTPPAGAEAAGPPTTAVLVRSRRQIPELERALRHRGLPVEVVGLGGLLDTPEVRDVVTTLQAMSDPTAGAALLRLLTGPRWRIGPRDVVALHRRARALAHERRQKPLEENAPAISDRLDDLALSEALEDLGPAGAYSPAGYRRLAAFAAELAELRSRMDQSLPDLVSDVEHTIGLDVEVAVAAGPGSGQDGDAGLGRAHLDTLGDVAARFAEDSEAATLAAFLAFLAAAEGQERGLEPGHVEVTEGAVQLLTVHAAKGLEWDVVALAGLSEGVFPGTPQPDHWLGKPGVLPFWLRGDASELPAFDVAEADDQRGLGRLHRRFKDGWKAHHGAEERRLAYVAVTRPRTLLLCSGYWWDGAAVRRRGPSELLDEVRERCEAGAGTVDEWAEAPPPDAVNPVTSNPATAPWPSDPLGDRRPALSEAADLVHAALAEPEHRNGTEEGDPDAAQRESESDPDAARWTHQPEPSTSIARREYRAESRASGLADDGDPDAARWAYQAELLLAERASANRWRGRVAVPDTLSVSDLVQLADDPDALARRIRRPLPSAPDRRVRRGTAFHRYLERRFGADGLLDVDDLPGAADADAPADLELAVLRRRFLAGPFADRTPVAVEVPFSTVLAGVVVRGRMDAVFAEPGGGYLVVDWKTGNRPQGRRARVAAVQLAAYRLAWAELSGTPVRRVGAAFHYVVSGRTERPEDLLGPDRLAALVTGLPPVDER